MDLASQHCVPCSGGVPPLSLKRSRELLRQLSGWKLVKNHHLEQEFSFPDFKTALHFVNSVGKIAEKEGHHPDLYLAWGNVGVKIWTHQVDGLTESDFVLAAKVEALRK